TQMAQGGQISQDVWVKLAPILGGDQYQIGAGASPGSGDNQLTAGGLNYAIVNGATTPDQIGQRVVLINKLLGYVPGDSAAAAALQRQLGILVAKLGAGTGPN